MRFSSISRTRQIVGGHTSRAVLLAVSFIVAVCACDKNTSNETVISAVDASVATESSDQYETAGSLIRQLVEQPDGRHVAVEINEENLQSLMASSSLDGSLQSFRDPLQAARLFAPHIGLPATAEFSILQRSRQVEEGSGLFIAVVMIRSSDQTTQMRLISEPDIYGQPTLWVLNDYDK